MNKLFITPILILSYFLLAACAQTRGYTPAIDTRASSPSATANIDRDLQECQALAEQAGGNTATETAIGTVAGGAMGAVTGAIVGAVSGGNIAKSAMIGGTAGGIGGAAKQGFESDSHYQRAFRDCMTGRGHRVIN
jgi:outer membrane lipoprotein SlyB